MYPYYLYISVRHDHTHTHAHTHNQALDKEDAFITKLRYYHPKARAFHLSKLLLRHQPAVLTIAKALVHTHNAEICLYAAKVTSRLSYRDGSLLVNMFEQSRQSAHICTLFASVLQNCTHEHNPLEVLANHSASASLSEEKQQHTHVVTSRTDVVVRTAVSPNRRRRIFANYSGAKGRYSRRARITIVQVCVCVCVCVCMCICKLY